jgi:CheY-like chemotaxis protein
MAAQRKFRLLLVDDDLQIVRLFMRILSGGGYSVTTTDRSAEVAQILREQTVDLLVLDLDMPRPDGFDLLRFLKQERPHLRILVVSGYLQGALLKASEILGATASLSKADAPKSLLKTVDAILK